ncbi:GNAT family N-acetyltransferase [uncultured Ramlibacter sp.]|uniref:GNAT family N-acetyltransferase n=1 Tax=uncultured Ramlibacter sp. TaxID=260755 RepID=UPI002627FFEE|nr:GNAT family N-acetyltransferase [uncultured Ramlibacter sp.]
MHLPHDDIEAIERATLAAVPPATLEEVHGWLLGLDSGTVGRAHSALPLRHDLPPAASAVQAIEARYAAKGLRCVLRLPHVAAFDSLRAGIAPRYSDTSSPVLVQVGTVQALAQLAGGSAAVQVADVPDAGWASVFLGEGFDPVDGASRVAILRRARDSVFASVQIDGRVVAVGCAGFSQGWVGIHGMRTAPACRGRGCAASILQAFAREAQVRGIARAFLQVEEANTGAQTLYRRAGFSTAWTYSYWRAR